MKLIQLEDNDAATIAAILHTHAEMQDLSATKSMELGARLKRDVPGDESQDMRDQLRDQADDLEEDAIDLKRLALMFN